MAINKRTCVDLVFLLFLVASFLFVGEVYGHSTSTSIDRETTLTGFGKEYNQTVVNFNTEPLRDGYYGSSGDYQSKFSDDFGKLARRQLREDMHEKKVAATLKRDDEVIVKLENAPIKRTNSVDSAVLGKYSVCRKENENVNADSTVRLMRDQLIMARAFISIAITKNRNNLAQELQSRIKEVQRALGEATTDADLPRSASERIKALNQALSKAKEQLYDCKLMTTKLRAMLQSADEQVRSSKKQSTFLSQLAAKTIPNGIHCLSLRLTIEYYLLPLEKRKFPRSQNLENPNLYHYALFSDNVLAASVVVNSTIMNAKVGHGKHRNQVKLEHGLEFGSFWDTCSCRYPWPVWRSLYAIVDV